MMNQRRLMEKVCGVRPADDDALQGWLQVMLGIDVPREAVCEKHVSPMQYLSHVFFEKEGDPIVWANRGGGKTYYGAVATLLDMIFKPGISIRILGGSLEQSQRMYSYLREMLERAVLCDLVAGKMTREGVSLRNGSRVELLAQSEASVRGQRVQKLRCDEVELFDRMVWEAGQFTTRSKICGGVEVRGSVEVFSTMHRPYGLMHELVEEAKEAGRGWVLLPWCALDVMGRCEASRMCEGCLIEGACEGRAKDFEGFLRVEDVINQRKRVSGEKFGAEMLCEAPSRSDAVFPEFSIGKHVVDVAARKDVPWVGGMDFGMRSPFVMLWGQVIEGDLHAGGRIEIMDEYVATDCTIREHIREIEGRGWPAVSWAGVDPAGHQRSEQTGVSSIDLLKDAGYRIKTKRLGLGMGIDIVRCWLEGVDGEMSLVIHPRCVKLIESLTNYHFDPEYPERKQPVKDGYDHAVDALRYMLMNVPRCEGVEVRWY